MNWQPLLKFLGFLNIGCVIVNICNGRLFFALFCALAAALCLWTGFQKD